MPLARLWWLLGRNFDFLTQKLKNYENDEPSQLGRLVAYYPYALSKIFAFLSQRIVKMNNFSIHNATFLVLLYLIINTQNQTN